MKPAAFEYHRPATAAEAAEMLAELDEAKVLAGGQSLIPMLALRLAMFDHLVDVGRVDELSGIERTDSTVRIGAGTTQATVERSDVVADAVPLLRRATRHIGHLQIRTRGTIGGSLAHADPAAEYPAVALALGARFEARSASGTRTIDADDFFTGLWSTALDEDELLTAVSFPVWSGRCGFAIEELARRHGDFALAGAAVALEVGGDDRVARCGIGLIGLGSATTRANAAEQQLVGTAVDDVDATAIGELAVADLDAVPSDVHASSDYRRKVGAVMVTRALNKAMQEATRA